MKKFIVCLALLALELGPLGAGTSQSVLVSASVPDIFSIETSTASVAFAFVEADYDAARLASKSVAGAHNLLVRSNRPWVVSFRSTTSAFGFTPLRGGADPAKPTTALSVRTGGAPFVAVTTSDQVLKTGKAGSVHAAGNTFPVDYHLASDLNSDTPGFYSLTVTYTVSTP